MTTNLSEAPVLPPMVTMAGAGASALCAAQAIAMPSAYGLPVVVLTVVAAILWNALHLWTLHRLYDLRNLLFPYNLTSWRYDVPPAPRRDDRRARGPRP